MRKETRQVERKRIEIVTEWIADDGEVFTTEEACRDYEESYKCTIVACFKQIPHLELSGSVMYLQYGQEDDLAYMLKPRNMEDIFAINRVFKYVDKNEYYGLLTQDDINKTIMINFGCEGIYKGGWYRIFKKEDYIKEITNDLNAFEKKLNDKTNNEEKADE